MPPDRRGPQWTSGSRCLLLLRRSILNCSGSQNSKIGSLWKGVEIIASLLDDVDRHSPDAPGTELRVAVAREDSRSVVQLLGVVVVEGAISLLADATAAGGPAERRERIRTAFAEVLTLEPRVRSERYHLWNEIERGFRTAHHLSSTRGEAFPDACHVLSILLRSAVADGDGGR